MSLNLPTRYPGRFNPPSAEYPQGSFKNRTAPGALDGSYLEQDWANDKEGFFQSLLDAAGISANDLVDEVGASQYYDALLQIIADNAADPLNAAIATVAAAGTIDLTAGAPGTSQLAISGTGVTINGFTVAANRFFIVKMTGATNTLVNSASLVTGRGANIPVAAGDSFLMRSTAANTVEIVCGSFLIDRGVGSGQTWQTVTRAFATNYTNTTGRTIVLSARSSMAAGATLTIVVAGVTASLVNNGTAGTATFYVTNEIPPGAVYSITGSGTLTAVELR